MAYRLPSEAEWEYACRAGTTGPFSFELPITTDKANYNDNDSYAGSLPGEFRCKTTPVRQFAPNPWGLYDMHGNVWEWCQDVWHESNMHYESYVGAPVDGTAWMTGGDQTRRVLRGGAWLYEPRYLRSAHRGGYDAGLRSFNFGLRLVKSL